MRESGVILLVENNKDFIYLLEQAFRKGDIKNPLKITRYGNEAILYLKGVGVYSDRKVYPLPALILLDLTIPDGSGLLVLGWFREQPIFDSVPVVVMVNSYQSRDLQRGLDLGANGYLVKKTDLDQLVEMIRSLELLHEVLGRSPLDDYKPVENEPGGAAGQSSLSSTHFSPNPDSSKPPGN